MSIIETILNSKDVIYLKKPKGRVYYSFWWESIDSHFLNVYSSEKPETNSKESVWVIRPDVHKFVSFLIKEGYQIYTKK